MKMNLQFPTTHVLRAVPNTTFFEMKQKLSENCDDQTEWYIL